MTELDAFNSNTLNKYLKTFDIDIQIGKLNCLVTHFIHRNEFTHARTIYYVLEIINVTRHS